MGGSGESAPQQVFTKETLALLPHQQAIDDRGTVELSFPVAPAADGQPPPMRTARGRWLSINDPDYQYYWNPDNIFDQWQIDAFSVDPHDLVADLKAIGITGRPMRVQQHAIMNKPVGALPKMLVYIAVHPEHGTRVFYPYTGARGGQKKHDTYQGYEYWCSDLQPWQKTQLVQFMHYNQTSAWSDQHAAARRAKVSAGPFNAEHFLVRYNSNHCFAILSSPTHLLCSGSLCMSKYSQATCNPTAAAASAFLSSLPASFLLTLWCLPHTSTPYMSPDGTMTT